MADHSIVHVEFPASNPKESAEFYTKLFGWKHEEFQGGYWMFDTGNGSGGGYNPVGPGGPGMFEVKPSEVLVYVNTDSIEDSLSKASSLGGKTITPKSPIPGMGWFAVFEDPTGNKVGLYTNDPAAPAM
jgi:predicted enzyme related to lactoylglutathione lyase